jgi:hypothetical protein
MIARAREKEEDRDEKQSRTEEDKQTRDKTIDNPKGLGAFDTIDHEYLTIEFVFHHCLFFCIAKSGLHRSFHHHISDCRSGFPSFSMLTRKI